MSKSVVVGVLLFIAGVIAGRMSVMSASPSPAEQALIGPSTTKPAAPGAPQPGGALHGRVAEVIQVPQYTYLRFESGDWAAVDSAPSVVVGAEVTLHLQQQMEDFTSPSLGRTFARLWFATLEGAAPVAKTGAPPAVAAEPTVPAVKGALAAVESSGALSMRVVDVFAERALLGGKRVRVSGKVDRVNAVQGFHYVHLKDGTGQASDKSDDLLCISDVEVTAGQSVVMEGVVALEKNVGMGVNPVVLDQAKVAR